MMMGGLTTLAAAALLMQRAGALGDPFWTLSSLSCLANSGLVAFPASVLVTSYCARGHAFRPLGTVGAGAVGLIAFGAATAVLACGDAGVLHTVFAHLLAPLSAGLAARAGLWALYVALRAKHSDEPEVV